MEGMEVDSRLSPEAAEAIRAVKERVWRESVVNMTINPLLTDLPHKFLEKGFFPHQPPIVSKIVEAFQYVDCVVLDAPTGTGKTIIGEVVRRMMRARAVYMCSSKSLQDQFLADFDYARVIKGRGNYPTECFADRYDPGNWASHLSAEDCTANANNGYQCQWCTSKHRCPYEIAKKQALAADVAVLNTSYFLAECNSVGRFRNRGLVIVDEADTLEQNLMGYVSVEISERRMEKWGWTPPAKLTVPSSWKDWIDAKLPELGERLLAVQGNDLAAERERKYITGLYEKLARIGKDLSEEHSWVYTGKGNDGGGRAAKNVGLEVSFKPSRVSAMAGDAFWQHGQKFLLMSATTISAQQMVEDDLGWARGYEVVKGPNTFPRKNRLVHYQGAVDMANKNKARSWPEVANVVDSILARHATDRVLVHTVSYDLTRSVGRSLSQRGRAGERPIFQYENAANRQATLGRFLATPNAVILAPSLDRGIDLPGDACRVQIVLKCPFPYIGDRQVAARMYSRGGDTWYAIQTIRAIVQMCGRAVRNADDWATTYILDQQFKTNLWARYRGLFPQWFAEAIVWEGR